MLQQRKNTKNARQSGRFQQVIEFTALSLRAALGSRPDTSILSSTRRNVQSAPKKRAPYVEENFTTGTTALKIRIFKLQSTSQKWKVGRDVTAVMLWLNITKDADT